MLSTSRNSFGVLGAADDTTLLVLGSLLESEDECDQQVVIGLLYEGPVQVVFTHPQFVERILEVCNDAAKTSNGKHAKRSLRIPRGYEEPLRQVVDQSNSTRD